MKIELFQFLLIPIQKSKENTYFLQWLTMMKQWLGVWVDQDLNFYLRFPIPGPISAQGCQTLRVYYGRCQFLRKKREYKT